MAMRTKIKLIVFFTMLEKVGGDFCVKETHAVPYNDKEFKSIKKMKEYVR